MLLLHVCIGYTGYTETGAWDHIKECMHIAMCNYKGMDVAAHSGILCAHELHKFGRHFSMIFSEFSWWREISLVIINEWLILKK